MPVPRLSVTVSIKSPHPVGSFVAPRDDRPARGREGAPSSGEVWASGCASAMSKLVTTIRRRSIAPSRGASSGDVSADQACAQAALESWQDGDPSMDTAANLAKRMELRHDPLVVNALSGWWLTAQHSIELEAGRTVLRPRQTAELKKARRKSIAQPNALMTREQYKKMSRKVCCLTLFRTAWYHIADRAMPSPSPPPCFADLQSDDRGLGRGRRRRRRGIRLG